MSDERIGILFDRYMGHLGPSRFTLCSEFSRIYENSDRVNLLEKSLKKFNLLGDSAVLRISKSNAIAERSRLEGNKFYKKSQFLQALECYNKSLCFAKHGSEQAGLAYSNRSAVFMELKLFKLCLENITKAKQHNAPAKTFEKLDQREEKCLEMIRDGVKETSSDPVGLEFFKLSRDPHPDVPFIVDCLQLEKTEELGRGIVTTKELKPGDVIAIEEPFASFLLTTERYKRCANCLKDNCLDLHPCSTCTVTMFCSKECEEVGNRKFHQFECPIVDRLDSLDAIQARVVIRTFFEAFDVCGGKIQQLKALVQKNSPDTTIFDFKHPTGRVNLLKAVDALETNEKKRIPSQLMFYAANAAIFYNLLINYTKLGDILKSNGDRDFLRSFIYKLAQTAMINMCILPELNLEPNGFNSNHPFGTALLPFSALVNHSCAPNVFGKMFNGKHCYVVSRVIEAGQQIFINYIQPHNSMVRQGRRQTLMEHFSFFCNCEACVMNYPLEPYLLRGTDEYRFKKFINDAGKLNQLDVKFAKERFELYRQFLVKYAHEYPSKETVMTMAFIEKCFSIFGSSEFKLKVLSK